MFNLDDGPENEEKNERRKKARIPGRKSFVPLDPGWYFGEIESVYVEEYDDKFAEDPDAKRDVVVFEIRVTSAGEEEIDAPRQVKCFCNLTVHEASNLSKYYRQLGVEKPPAGGTFDGKQFEGLDVKVRLDIKKKSGNVLNSVEDMKAA